ncbi:MAG: hypothetical protein K2J88_05505, partial [Oscillospiraceae bacterium]|nr:hypothetical protein [Oscillospiraceae bacterium]
GLISEKATRNSQGLQVLTLKAKQKLISAEIPEPEQLSLLEKYRVKNIPANGKLAKDLEDENQLFLI